MKLLGKRVLLSVPQKPESVIELSEETQKQLEMEFIQRWTELEIFEVGQEVTSVKKSDKVYVPSSSLSNAERIIIGEETKMMIAEFEIAIIWNEVYNKDENKI